MALKITSNLVENIKPVIETGKGVVVIQCKDYKDKPSSVKGLISKFMYISKIDQFTCNVETPTLRIECGSECIDKCINIK